MRGADVIFHIGTKKEKVKFRRLFSDSQKQSKKLFQNVMRLFEDFLVFQFSRSYTFSKSHACCFGNKKAALASGFTITLSSY
jgi:hypothetical protein